MYISIIFKTHWKPRADLFIWGTNISKKKYVVKPGIFMIPEKNKIAFILNFKNDCILKSPMKKMDGNSSLYPCLPHKCQTPKYKHYYTPKVNYST